MRYINQLQADNAELTEKLELAQAEISELLGYLSSSKFYNEDWVSAREMFTKLITLRSNIS